MSLTFQLVVIATSAVLVPALCRHWKDVRSKWNSTSTAVFAIAWLLNITYPLAEITGDYTLVRDTADGGVSLVYGEVTQRFHLASLGIAAMLCIFMAIRALRMRGTFNSPALLAIALLFVTVTSAFQENVPVDWRAAGGMLLILAVAAVLPAGVGARLGAALFGLSALVASAALLVTKTAASTRPCDLKCGPLGVLYTGIFPNENALGLTVALAAPFVLVGLRGSVRNWAIIASEATILASDSRTAQFAFVLTLATFFLMSALSKKHVSFARTLLATLVSSLAAIGLILPFYLGSVYSNDFTGRTELWGVGTRQFKEQWLLGWGQGGWRAVSLDPLHGEITYSPHNQWLAILIYGGVVGAILFGLLLVSIQYSDHHGFAGGLILVAALSAGVLERPWSMASPDWLFWSLMGACLSGNSEAPALGPGMDRKQSGQRDPCSSSGITVK